MQTDSNAIILIGWSPFYYFPKIPFSEIPTVMGHILIQVGPQALFRTSRLIWVGLLQELKVQFHAASFASEDSPLRRFVRKCVGSEVSTLSNYERNNAVMNSGYDLFDWPNPSKHFLIDQFFNCLFNAPLLTA